MSVTHYEEIKTALNQKNIYDERFISLVNSFYFEISVESYYGTEMSLSLLDIQNIILLKKLYVRESEYGLTDERCHELHACFDLVNSTQDKYKNQMFLFICECLEQGIDVYKMKNSFEFLKDVLERKDISLFRKDNIELIHFLFQLPDCDKAKFQILYTNQNISGDDVDSLLLFFHYMQIYRLLNHENLAVIFNDIDLSIRQVHLFFKHIRQNGVKPGFSQTRFDVIYKYGFQPSSSAAITEFLESLILNKINRDENKETLIALFQLTEQFKFGEACNAKFADQLQFNHEIFERLACFIDYLIANDSPPEFSKLLKKLKPIIIQSKQNMDHPYELTHQLKFIINACLNPKQENIDGVMALANELQGHPSASMKSLGLTLLSLGIALAGAAAVGVGFFSLSMGIATPIIFAAAGGLLAGYGFYAYGRTRTGLSHDALDLAVALEKLTLV